MHPGRILEKKEQHWAMTFRVKSTFEDDGWTSYSEVYTSMDDALFDTENHDGEYICLFGRYFDSQLGRVNTISYNSHEIEDLLMEVKDAA